MNRWKTNLALGAVMAAAALAACNDDGLSCGPGTTESDGECIVSGDGDGGMGGESTSGSAFDPRLADVPPERRADAALVLEEFAGAIAAGPASRTSAVVVWEPSTAFGVSYNIYVADGEDDFSFVTPQFEAPPGAPSALLTGLTDGEEHFIIVRPVIEGIELPVEDVSVSVELADDEEAPSFVGVTEVESADGAAVKVSWDAASDDLSPDAVLTYLVYAVEEGEESEFRAPTAVSRPGATSVTVALPLPDHEYDIVVRARDAAGNTDENIEFLTGTSGPDVEAPVFSGCAEATARNASTADLSWAPAVDDIAGPDDIVYNIYASTEPDGHNFSEPSATVVGGTGGAVTELLANETYYFICRAADPSGNEEENESLKQAKTAEDDQPPVFAGITAVENIGAESFQLVWEQATDNQSLPEEITYNVYTALTEDGHDLEGSVAATIQGQGSVTVEDVDSRTDYFVVVIAVDGSGNATEAGVAVPVTTLVSLRRDIELPIFQNKCATTGCHSGDTPVSGLNLSPGFSFLNLVGVTPTTTAGLDSGFDLVDAFLPNASHLVERIEAVQGVAPPSFPMPQSGDSLTAQEISTIRQWITEGALNN